jgi:hypothetical protein
MSAYLVIAAVRRHAALGIVLLLSGCQSWRVQEVSPAEFMAERRPDAVRLGRPDGSQLVVQQPMVRNDSVVSQAAGDTTGLPLSDVSAVAVRKVDGIKTVGAVVLITGVSAALACVAGGCDYGLQGFSRGQ